LIIPKSPFNNKINSINSFTISLANKKKLSKRQLSFKSISIKSIALPSKSGWLKKKSPNPMIRWQKRFCRIEEKKFFYYKNEKDIHPLGCLDFDLTSIQLNETKKDKKIVQFKLIFTVFIKNSRKISFSVLDSGKKFVFKNFDKKNNDLLYWSETIKTNINASLGFANSLQLLKTPKFWKDIRISQKQFRQKADTLDILLFQSNNLRSKLQRSFTRSQYDHVAIILRYGDNEMSFLEAESPGGVGICNWNTFMRNRWYNLYKYIWFRHIEIERNDDFFGKIERFINVKIQLLYFFF